MLTSCKIESRSFEQIANSSKEAKTICDIGRRQEIKMIIIIIYLIFTYIYISPSNLFITKLIEPIDFRYCHFI